MSDASTLFIPPGLTCDLGSHRSTGFTNLGAGTDQQWWVCAECGRPTTAWLQSQGDDMLNFLRGGPLDGSAYATSTLLDRSQGHIPIEEYRWTPEVAISQTTHATARVWVHESIKINDSTYGPVVKPGAPTAAPTGYAGSKIKSQEDTMATKAAAPADTTTAAPTAAEKRAAASAEKKAAAETAKAEKAAAKAAAAPTATGDTALLARRVAGGFSRKQAADAAGMTTAQIWRVEQGKGKTSNEEIAAVAAGLDKLEAFRAAAPSA